MCICCIVFEYSPQEVSRMQALSSGQDGFTEWMSFLPYKIMVELALI